MADIGEYKILGKLGEGTFSEVIRVKHKKTNKLCAMKRFKKRFGSVEEIETLREIQALRRLNKHSNIIQLEEVIFDAKYGMLCLCFELMDSNLYEVLSKKSSPPLSEFKAKWIMWQMMKALDFVHSKGIFHRDIKPENILVRGDVHAVPFPFPSNQPGSPYALPSSFPLVKIADFGSCRGIHSKMPYTEYIATRWYRSPECLLFDGVYNYKMDVWGIGCVFFELLTKIPLFPGDDELDQLHKIHSILGTPSDKALKAMVSCGTKLVEENSKGVLSGNRAAVLTKGIFKKPYQFPATIGIGLKAVIPQHILVGGAKMASSMSNDPKLKGLNTEDFPGLSDECVEVVEMLIQYDPDIRPSARHVMKHSWLQECRNSEQAEKTNNMAKNKAAETEEPVTSGLPAINGATKQQKVKTNESKDTNSPKQIRARPKGFEKDPSHFAGLEGEAIKRSDKELPGINKSNSIRKGTDGSFKLPPSETSPVAPSKLRKSTKETSSVSPSLTRKIAQMAIKTPPGSTVPKIGPTVNKLPSINTTGDYASTVVEKKSTKKMNETNVHSNVPENYKPKVTT